VFDDYEKVGADFYCRHCDWSSSDLKRVEAHMESYHPDVLSAGPTEVVDAGNCRLDDQAKDPGKEATASETDNRAVPAQSPPPPRTPPKAENVKENAYWEIVDGIFHCIKCKQLTGVNWTTPQRAAMSRHAKKHHGYETMTDRKKKAAKT